YLARLFFVVWILVLFKIDNLDVTLAVGGIANYEPMRRELVEQLVHIAIVIRQNFSLNSFWPVCEPTFSIRDTPQSHKQQATESIHFCQVVIGEKTRFNISRSGHYAPFRGIICAFIAAPKIDAVAKPGTPASVAGFVFAESF